MESKTAFGKEKDASLMKKKSQQPKYLLQGEEKKPTNQLVIKIIYMKVVPPHTLLQLM